MSDELVDVTSVRVITSDDDRKVALVNPQSCLQILLNHAGNLNAFVKYFRAHAPEEKQAVLFAAYRMIKSDKALYREWKEAINLNRAIRIDLLQFEALDRLEGNRTGYEEKHTDKGTVVKFKEADDIANAKLVLADAFAGRIAQARAKPTNRTSDTNDDIMDDDDDLTKAMEDA